MMVLGDAIVGELGCSAGPAPAFDVDDDDRIVLLRRVTASDSAM